MALPPADAAAPAMEEDAGAPAPADDPGAGDAAPEEEGDSGEVLLTVCKEADGTYRLIQGDEEDAEPAAGGEAEGAGATDEGSGKVYDSKGTLLKGILDILNEDEQSAGAGGSSEDQFQSGFGGAAGGAAPAGPMLQKYKE